MLKSLKSLTDKTVAPGSYLTSKSMWETMRTIPKITLVKVEKFSMEMEPITVNNQEDISPLSKEEEAILLFAK